MKKRSAYNYIIILSFILFSIYSFSSCGSSGGGGDNLGDGSDNDQQLAEQYIDQLDDFETAWEVGKHFYTYSIRQHIPDTFSDEVSMLLSPEADAGGMLTDKFMEEAVFGQDTSLCIYAYLIEQLNYREAVPTLITWLESNIFNDVLRAPDCVTHALKVLTDQDDLDNIYYTYDFDEILDALDRAEKWQSSALSHIRNWIAGLFSPAPAVAAGPNPSTGGRCLFQTEIKGKDKKGNPIKPVPIKGYIYKKDYDDIGSPADKAKKLKEEGDNIKYGDSNDPERYDPVPGAKISREQDCGGIVSERVLKIKTKYSSSDPSPVRDALEAGIGDELPNPDEIPDFDDKSKMVTVIEEAGGTVRHVSWIENRPDGSKWAMSKDDHGYLRQKKLDFKMKNGKKVWYLKTNDKQRTAYPDATLRIFEVKDDRVGTGSVPNTKCSTSSSCPPSSGGTPLTNWSSPLANSLSYVTCSVISASDVTGIYISAKNIKVNAVIHYNSGDQHYVGYDSLHFFSETDEPSSYSELTFYQSYLSEDGNAFKEMYVKFNQDLTKVIEFSAFYDTTVTGENIPGGSYAIQQEIEGTSIDVDSSDHRLFRITGANACDKIGNITYSQTGEGVSNWEVLGVAEEGCDKDAELTIQVTIN